MHIFKLILAFILAGIVAALSFYFINTGCSQPPVTEPTTISETEPLPTSPQSWSVSLASLQALGLPEFSVTVDTVNNSGTVKSYAITGVRLKDVLAELLGVDDLSFLPDDAATELTVLCTGYAPAVCGYDRIVSDDTYLAFVIDGSAGDAPRLIPMPDKVHTDGNTYVFNGDMIKNVDTLTLVW